MATSISVHSLTQADKRKYEFNGILSLMDVEARPSQLLRFHRSGVRRPTHLTLRFDDLDIEYETAPRRDHVEASIAFGRRIEGSLLVHCHAGISRSGAIGYALLADVMGPGREEEALDCLLKQRPEACPNGRITRFADDFLGRKGALLGAYEARLAARPDWQDLKRRQREAWAQDRPDLFPDVKPLRSPADFGLG